MGRCAQNTFLGRSDWQSIYPAPVDVTAEWFIILPDALTHPPLQITAPASKSPPVWTTTHPSSPCLSRGGRRREGRVKRTNRNKTGMRREGQIYVGVRPFSAPVCPDWRETSAPLIQCFPRDNKSERVRSVREGERAYLTPRCRSRAFKSCYHRKSPTIYYIRDTILQMFSVWVQYGSTSDSST